MLDQNLFTLHLTPHPEDANVTDLIDPSGTIHYRKQRVPGLSYKTEVYDFMSESLLVTVSAPSATSKQKILELYNPTIMVELKYTGTLSFRWNFKWEEHEFEWKREECFILRKPDPSVLVAVTKEPPGRIKTSTVQILDYNLNRFDINDRKGLEIVILTALLSFQDSSDAYHGSRAEGSSSSIPTLSTIRKSPDNAPAPPPKPPQKTGLDRVVELQAIRTAVNEVTVVEECGVQDYAQYCANLLQDDAMLFITVISSASKEVPKVLQVVEETKRIRHKAGLGQDLHQYVLYDTNPNPSTPNGPRRINLNEDSTWSKDLKVQYAPPSNLTVHLSKIPMPELQPRSNTISARRTQSTGGRPTASSGNSKKVARDAEEKRRKKEAKKNNKNTKPSSSPPRQHLHIPSSQTHPYQPTPSPSQLNNPGIYASPLPPARPHSHPRIPPSPPNGPLPPYLGAPGGGTWVSPPSGAPPPSPGQKPSVVDGFLDKFSSWRP